MAHTTEKEILDIWEKVLERIIYDLYKKDDNERTLNPDLFKSEEIEYFTKKVIPADLQDTILYIYADENTANELLTNKSSKWYRYAPLVETIFSHESFKITDAKIVLTRPGIDKSSYHDYKRMKDTLMPRMLRALNSRINSEILYKGYKEHNLVGLDNIISGNPKKKDRRYRQSNKLNKSKYNLTLTQKKILSYLTFMYQYKKDSYKLTALGDALFEFKASDLIKAGCGENATQIKKNLLTDLQKMTIEIPFKNGDWCAFPVFSIFTYKDKSKIYELSLSANYIGFINQIALHQEYSIINYETISSLKSYYATRLYELCAQYRNSKNYVCIIGDEQLRKILNCENKYSQPFDFKRRILDVAKKELDAMYESGESDITFSIHPMGKSEKSINGRKNVSTWVFNIKLKALCDDNFSYISNKEKEELCDDTIKQIYDRFHLDEEIELFIAYEKYKSFDFQSKIKATRELQFHLNEINKNKWIFSDIINEIN